VARPRRSVFAMPALTHLTLGLAAGCAVACALSAPASSEPNPTPPGAAVRANGGPARLVQLLARYDRMPAGPAKDLLAAEIDAVAHQKYATVSRLYWHTDLAAAQAAARESDRPILHLRMLGRLDEDLSCANSRLFRTTLYANQEVSAFLRDHFVLYWSSERPVPRVTIDYGDGRKLERTTTGNSAHYVLDETGAVLDVLPGLYAPVAFQRELAGSLALAWRVRGASADERARAVVAHHRAQTEAANAAWAKLAGAPYLPGAGSLLTQEHVVSALAVAQRATFAKAAIEVPDLRYIVKDLAPAAWPADQIAMWASAGQILYGIGDLERDERASEGMRGPWGVGGLEGLRGNPARRGSAPAPPRVLDAQSRALVGRLHDAVPEKLRGTATQKDAMIARLEQNLVADSALNQLRLRPSISREIIRRGGRLDFDALNAWVYAAVFATPRSDEWLGLLPRTDFSGLPGDGVVIE
jgi:hypothetical protein